MRFIIMRFIAQEKSDRNQWFFSLSVFGPAIFGTELCQINIVSLSFRFERVDIRARLVDVSIQTNFTCIL